MQSTARTAMSIEAATRCAKPQPSKRLQRRRTCEPSVTSSLSMLPECNHLYLSQWSVFVTAVCLPWWIKRSKRKHRTICFCRRAAVPRTVELRECLCIAAETRRRALRGHAMPVKQVNRHVAMWTLPDCCWTACEETEHFLNLSVWISCKK